MGIFDKLRGKKPSDQPKALPMVETIGGAGLFSHDDRKGGLEEYRGWTFACVRSIAEKMSSIELELKRRNGDDVETIHDHPMLSLFRDVNPFMTFPDLIVSTQSYLELEGSAFWWITKGEGNIPVGVWPLRPDLISVVPDETTFVKEYVYQIGSKKFVLSPDDVIPFKEFNPKDPFKGLGTTYAAASSINSDNYARAWQTAFFKNGARIDGVITKDGEMTEEEHKTLQARWRDKYQGTEKSHKTAILSNGLKYQPIGATPQDMDFVNLRTMSRDEILAMFRVPKTVLGVTDGTATRATAETSEYVFMKETISPKMQKFVRTMNEYLLPMFGLDTQEYSITYKDPVPANRELTLAGYANGLANGWLAINEVRAMEGKPPIENGDAPRVGFGTEALGEPMEIPKSITNARPQGKSSVKSVAKELASVLAPAFKEIADMETFERNGEALQKAQVKRGESYEKKLTKIMEEYLGEAQERILSAFDDTYKKNVKATKAASDNLVDPEAEAEEIVKKVKKFFNILVQAEGESAMGSLGLDIAFDIRNERVQEALKKTMAKFAGEVSESTRDAIRDAIATGLDEGEDIPDLRKRIETAASFDKARAETIARTETSRAQNFATVTAWKESEVVEGKIWYTALDERVEEECANMHGKEFELDENMDPGNDYGPIEGPPLHPNCRCTLVPIVKSKAVHAPIRTIDLLAELDAVEKELGESDDV